MVLYYKQKEFLSITIINKGELRGILLLFNDFAPAMGKA